MNLIVIGSSRIVIDHILVAKKVGFKIHGIFSSRKKSKNAVLIKNRFGIKKNFSHFNELIKYALKNNCYILIAGKLSDNKKILKICVKNKIKVFIEKPVFFELKDFNYFEIYKKNIFVGYNRLFYKNIEIIKKKLVNKKKLEIVINCPEKNLTSIKRNSCHIISIILHLFPDIKIIFSKKNGLNYFIRLSSSKGYINLFFSLSSPDNFSITILSKEERILFSPIENLKIFKGIEKKISHKGNIYIPKIILDKSEYNYTKYKPGFLNQMKSFKKFVKNQKTFYPNISFAKKIMTFCDSISKLK